ncbi:MAG: hypothetical protein ACLFVU_09770 [Phycisphaerae bacterium]
MNQPIVLVAVLIPRGDELLLLARRDGSGGYTTQPMEDRLGFGERSEEAARRIVRHAIAAELTNLRRIDVREIIVDRPTDPKHRITILYQADLSNPALYDLDYLEGQTPEGEPADAVWVEAGEPDDL